MHVEKQNLLFKYFSDTLAAIIAQAKRSGRYDQVSNTIFFVLFRNFLLVGGEHSTPSLQILNLVL